MASSWFFLILQLSYMSLICLRKKNCSRCVYNPRTHSLTHSMEQSPSWEADRPSASQEIPPHFIEPEDSLPHSQVPVTCPYPGVSSIQSIPPHCTAWRSILILSPLLRLGPPSGLFPAGSPHQNPVYASHLPHTRYMTLPPHSTRVYHPNNIGWSVQIIKLLIM